MADKEKRLEIEKSLLVDILQAVRESLVDEAAEVSPAFLIEASRLIEKHPEPEVAAWLRNQIEQLIGGENGPD